MLDRSAARFLSNEVCLRDLLRPVRLTDEASLDLKANGIEELCDFVRVQSVRVERNGVTVALLDVHALVPDLECHRHVSAIREDSRKLSKCGWQEGQRRVDDRVPRGDPS